MLSGGQVTAQDALQSCKELAEISDQEIKLLKQQLAAQDQHIKDIRKQRDAALASSQQSCGLLHDVGAGLVGAAAGIVLIRGFR